MHHAARLAIAIILAGLTLALTAPIAAHAAIIAVATGDAGARRELHDIPGPCLGNARMAVYVKGPERIPGCWIAGAGEVQIAWLDGDTTLVSAGVFRKPEDV
mgnify:CR=1 FL=1